MHGPIQDRLEELLEADRSVAGHHALMTHLASCSECSSELSYMKAQAAQLSTLRASGELEAEPGFYARVLQRIEDQSKFSIWSVLIDAPFTKRIAFASLTLAVGLGTYVIAQESRYSHSAPDRVIAETSNVHHDFPVTGDPTQQRDAVLENIAEHQGIVQ